LVLLTATLALPRATFAELCKFATAKLAAAKTLKELPRDAAIALGAEAETCRIAADALLEACWILCWAVALAC